MRAIYIYMYTPFKGIHRVRRSPPIPCEPTVSLGVILAGDQDVEVEPARVSGGFGFLSSRFLGFQGFGFLIWSV